ncbi:MAG TPA: FHA domain-containing protein, partial [Holophaga sp.]|nr:FHA domain-containing protein [Holophaga sp.]
MAKLLIQENNGVREFELVDNEIQIGRELDNALRLADPSISRHHAVLRRTAAGYEVQDLGSSNGVLVNGVKVQVSPLQDGDRLTLGQLQIDFADPRPPQEADVPDPLGTVRITPEEM